MDHGERGKSHKAINLSSIGRPDFTQRHDLHSPARQEQIASILAEIKQNGIEVVRFSVVDTNGQVRTRPIEARHFEQAALNGVPFTSALFAMDSGNHIFRPIFSSNGGFGLPSMSGAGDMLGVADLASFRVLPWANKAAFVLADLYLTDGEPCPFDPRLAMRRACAALDEEGLAYVCGIEIECHVFKIVDPRLSLEDCMQPSRPADVAAYRHGYQHLSQLVLDEYEPVIDRIRHALIGLGLPLRSVECEWGPGQLEITLDPMAGLEAADAALLTRAAVKQVVRRSGLIASFMTKPALPNVYSCGWHMHQSLVHVEGRANAFVSPESHLSDIGAYFLGGLLQHVRAASAFSNPSINGYKRLNANSLAPKRASWSIDNKGAMCRLVGGVGDRSTHIENRIGEPLANPYLYMASQIFAGLDGIAHGTEPGAPSADPHHDERFPSIPRSLMEAIDALDDSRMFRAAMKDEFIDHFVSMKRHEIDRFLSSVTDWEHREYFESF